MTEQTSPDNQRAAFQAAAQQQIDDEIAKRSSARQTAAPPPAEAPAVTIARRTDNLRAALTKAVAQDWVTLPELSKRSENGEPVRLRCRRMTVQELAATGLLPTRADKLVSEIIDRSLDVTEVARNEYGLARRTVSQDDIHGIVDEVYGGWTRDAVAAFLEFQSAMVCAVVIDPDYRMVMTYDEVLANPQLNVLVWDLPQEDRDAIFQWALQQEENAVASVMPFRDTGVADVAAQSGGAGTASRFSPDDV